MTLTGTTPSTRRELARQILIARRGTSEADLAERLEVSIRTARRYLRQLESLGENVTSEVVSGRRLWRIEGTRPEIVLGLHELVSLEAARVCMSAYAGTGLFEGLESAMVKVEATMSSANRRFVRAVRAKLESWDFDRYDFGDRAEQLDDIATALGRDQRLALTHGAVEHGMKEFVFDLYRIGMYKRGLYLVGYSHFHQSVRTFNLHGIRRVRWLRGQSVPTEGVRGDEAIGAPFGIIRGPRTMVRIAFDADVARIVARRRWHPSQKITRTPEGIELDLVVDGTTELLSWLLSFGDKAVILEPETLRAQVVKIARKTLSRYVGEPGDAGR